MTAVFAVLLALSIFVFICVVRTRRIDPDDELKEAQHRLMLKALDRDDIGHD